MKNKKMRVQVFSKVVYRILTVAVIIYAVMAVTDVLSEIWAVMDGVIETTTIGRWLPFGLDVQLLRIGQSSIVIPAVNFGFAASPYMPIPNSLVAQVALFTFLSLLLHGMIAGCLMYTRFIFGQLKNGASPFSQRVVWFIRMLALIATIRLIYDMTLIGIILVVIVWLIYYAFEYGRTLQDESDTTL